AIGLMVRLTSSETKLLVDEHLRNLYAGASLHLGTTWNGICTLSIYRAFTFLETETREKALSDSWDPERLLPG
ncbi:MAG: hypothetical protein ACE5F1_08870, partial [Planctomycetota bacterium]